MHSREQLAEDFRALGVEPGDTVMVHASVRSVGEVAGGPDQIHLALGDALAANGTILMYASCPQYVDEVGRGKLTPEQEAEVLEKLPAFDAHTARSARDNGALVEMLRTWPGARVNEHPARFVARGAQAEFLLSHQPWDFAFGEGSALDRFVAMGGKILLLGSDHDTVTFLHYAEHIVDVPDKRVVRFRVPILEDGVRRWPEMAEFDTSGGAHPNWPDRFFALITDTYLAQSRNRGARVGQSRSYLFSARELLDFALPVMRAVAADPGAASALRELPEAER